MNSSTQASNNVAIDTKAGLPPHPTLRDHYADEGERRARLSDGFGATARYYDRINALTSFGSDRSYRRRALRLAGLKPGMAVLDVGCGTGMTAGLARDIVGPNGEVVGVDPSAEMIAVAREKGRVDHAALGTAQALPVPAERFDFVTMTFALRHVGDLRATFEEYLRVLKPGGRVLLLEISTPNSGWRLGLLRFHMKRIVPVLAFLCARRRTARWLYDYCWDSHEHCVRPEVIEAALVGAGFADVNRRVELGIFSAYTGIRPAA